MSLSDYFVQSYVSWNPSFYVSTGRSRKPSFKDKTNNHQYNTCYHRLGFRFRFRFFVEPAKKAWLSDLIVCGLFSRQEGWRLENEDPTDNNSPLMFKGVVFNEMKGAFVSWHSHKASKCIEYNIFINALFSPPRVLFGYKLSIKCKVNNSFFLIYFFFQFLFSYLREILYFHMTFSFFLFFKKNQ